MKKPRKTRKSHNFLKKTRFLAYAEADQKNAIFRFPGGPPGKIEKMSKKSIFSHFLAKKSKKINIFNVFS